MKIVKFLKNKLSASVYRKEETGWLVYFLCVIKVNNLQLDSGVLFF